MKNKRGVTLIELVVVLGLTGIVLSLIFPPVILSYNYFDMQNERISSISDSRAVMNYLTTQIRKSNDIEVGTNTIKLDSGVYKIENKTLYKDGLEVFRGIDNLKMDKVGKKIDIEIVFKDYKLKSSIYLR